MYIKWGCHCVSLSFPLSLYLFSLSCENTSPIDVKLKSLTCGSINDLLISYELLRVHLHLCLPFSPSLLSFLSEWSLAWLVSSPNSRRASCLQDNHSKHCLDPITNWSVKWSLSRLGAGCADGVEVALSKRPKHHKVLFLMTHDRRAGEGARLIRCRI